jgi:hypothetical protein
VVAATVLGAMAVLSELTAPEADGGILTYGGAPSGGTHGGSPVDAMIVGRTAA